MFYGENRCKRGNIIWEFDIAMDNYPFVDDLPMKHCHCPWLCQAMSDDQRVMLPIGSMYAIYMVTFTINIPPMLAYIPYMDPMGYVNMTTLVAPLVLYVSHRFTVPSPSMAMSPRRHGEVPWCWKESFGLFEGRRGRGHAEKNTNVRHNPRRSPLVKYVVSGCKLVARPRNHHESCGKPT